MERNNACYSYNAEEVFEGLKSAYEFLKNISKEMLDVQAYNENGEDPIETVLSKINVLWHLFNTSDLEEIDNRYCLVFNKKSLMKYKSLKNAPASYSKALEGLKDNGVYIEFFKNGKLVKNQSFSLCESGKVFFDDFYTTLGLYVFVKRVTEKRWYWESDKAGNYSNTPFKPMLHCIEPYNRADMRIFTSNDRLKYDPWEHYAGYDEQLIRLIRQIDSYIRANYNEYRTGQGFYKYILCTVSYNRGFTERLLLSLGVGHSENAIGYYSTLKGKEIEDFSPKVVNCVLHQANCRCSFCMKNKKTITYRGATFNNPLSSYEFRFNVDGEGTVKDIIRLIDIKVKRELKTKRG